MRLRIRSLALLSGLRIWRCPELWCRLRHGSDPELLWLWRRLVATALIRPLAWETPYAMEVAQEMAKIQKTNKQKNTKNYPTNQVPSSASGRDYISTYEGRDIGKSSK